MTIILLGLAILFFVGSIFFAAVGFTPYDLYFDEHVFFAKNSFRLMLENVTNIAEIEVLSCLRTDNADATTQ